MLCRNELLAEEMVPVRSCWQKFFRSPLTGRPLSYKGETQDGVWTNGVLLTRAGTQVASVSDGIVDFVGASISSRSFVAQTRQGGVSSNWQGQAGLLGQPAFAELAGAAIEAGRAVGPILEIGAGPGGGMMPLMLGLHPEAEILANDIETVVISELSRFLRTSVAGPNVSYAVFDACNVPLVDNCVGCVTSLGGFSNIESHRELALKEACRVLSPGGLLVLVDGDFMGIDGLKLADRILDSAGLPPDLATGIEPMFRAMMHAISTPVHELVRAVGFAVRQDEIVFRKRISPAESELARLAARCGVTMDVEFHGIIGRK